MFVGVPSTKEVIAVPAMLQIHPVLSFHLKNQCVMLRNCRKFKQIIFHSETPCGLASAATEGDVPFHCGKAAQTQKNKLKSYQIRGRCDASLGRMRP